MCQHSWYDKNRRHYGRKPNTRRARGLPNRNLGISTGPHVAKSPSNLPVVEIDTNINETTTIPSRMSTIKRYAKIYNYYVQHYDKFHDKNICIEAAMNKFKTCRKTVYNAIRVCKYILATTPQEVL